MKNWRMDIYSITVQPDFFGLIHSLFRVAISVDLLTYLQSIILDENFLSGVNLSTFSK